MRTSPTCHRSGAGLGFVYQQYHLFPHLSVRDNIGYGLTGRGGRNGAASGPSRRTGGSAGHRPRCSTGRYAGSAAESSNGWRWPGHWRPRPSILLLDEPFAAVDPATRQVLRRELRELHEREGITTLQVTHDFDEALRLGDLVAVLSEGRIAQSGTPEQVFRYPNSAFVARFVGTGNVIAGAVQRNDAADDRVRFRGRFQGENLSLDVVAEREGPAHAVIRPEDIVLSLTPHPDSARNHKEAVVTGWSGWGRLPWCISMWAGR